MHPISEPARRQPPKAVVPAIFALALVLLLFHAARYYPFLSDDSLISLRYSQRLLEGKGLTWTDGERVEGYSNLLWVLACSGLGLVGVNLIAATRILGAAFMALTLGALVWRDRSLRRYPALLSLPAFALALSGTMAIWLIGGLEQAMLVGLLAVATAGCLELVEADPVRRPRLTGIAALAFALMALTRPDALIFPFTMVPVLFLGGGRSKSLKTGLPLVGLPVLFSLGQLVFRWFYYHDFVPNTAHVKVSPGGGHLAEGLRYIFFGLFMHAGLVIPALALAAAALFSSHGPRRARMALLLSPFLVWSAYVIFIGGDIFPGRRHLIPLVVLLAFMLGEGLRELPSTKIRPALLCGAGCLGLLAFFQFFDPENFKATEERWEWDGQVAGTFLKTAFADQQPLVAVDPAGCIPYFSELPSLDMMGLNDRTIALRETSSTESHMLGHEKGDGAYVLRRRPDIVVFRSPGGHAEPLFLSGLEMFRQQEFHDHYRLVHFLGTKPYPFKFQYYLRIDSPKIGPTRTGDDLSVPAYYVADTADHPAVLDGSNIVVPLFPGDTATLTNLKLPPGQWTVHAATVTGDSLRITHNGRPARQLAGTVTLQVHARPEDPTQLRSLEFHRLTR